jgi:hypothetical protein
VSKAQKFAYNQEQTSLLLTGTDYKRLGTSDEFKANAEKLTASYQAVQQLKKTQQENDDSEDSDDNSQNVTDDDKMKRIQK